MRTARGRDRVLVTVQAMLGLALAIAWWRSPAAVGIESHVVALGLWGLAGAVGAPALWALRRVFRVAPTPRRDGELIARGIYRWLRHPMYTAVVLIVTGVAVVRPDPFVLGLAGLNLAFYLAKARYEEGLLLSHYPGYADYRRRTVGVLPGW